MNALFAWFQSVGDALPPAVAFWRAALPDTARQFLSWLVIAALFLIPAGLAWALWRRSDVPSSGRVAGWVAFLLLFALALWQLGVALGRTAVFPNADALAAATLAIGLLFLLLIWLVLRRAVQVPSPRRLMEDRNRVMADRAGEVRKVQEAEARRAELQLAFETKAAELALVSSRLDTCIRGAKVYLFTQNRDLRYVGAFGPRGEEIASQMLGRSDEELFAESERDSVIAIKKKVLETGEPAEIEAWHEMPGGRKLLNLHIEPITGANGAIEGLRAAAADITRVRALEGEQRRLADELRNALHRYEIALRGSNVTVFTQDRDLRYNSISNGFLGKRVDQIIGATDDEVLPGSERDALVALKRRALERGEPEDAELRIKTGAAAARWYDFHIEPLRDAEGKVVGLTCAAVDITEQKAAEEHLRLLMRELTHRSKNLLAVIQALARQTSRGAVSIDAFVEQFGARLQALSRSHDLLVQEEWHSASLRELVRSQLSIFLEGENPQITVEGPEIHLKPEAAQSLGLAVHELAVNAAKFGALSVPDGRVSVVWDVQQPSEGGLILRWSERDGPPVTNPDKRGFGTLAIQRNLARTLESDVELTFAESGVNCTISVPEQHLFRSRREAAEV